jgi:hypothetical protein
VSFDNSVLDATHHAEVRAREFANLDLPGTPPTVSIPVPPVLAPHAQVERLATGFFSNSGGAVDASGTLYFVDTHWQRIFKWDAKNREVVNVSSAPLEPENLAFDKAGNLLVVSRNGAGKVFSFRPDVPPDTISLLKPEKGPGQYLPDAVFAMRGFATDRPWHYGSAENGDGISSGDDFVNGHTEWGTKMADLVRTFGLQKTVPGHPFYVTSESEEATYRGTVMASRSMCRSVRSIWFSVEQTAGRSTSLLTIRFTPSRCRWRVCNSSPRFGLGESFQDRNNDQLLCMCIDMHILFRIQLIMFSTPTKVASRC